MIDAILRGGLVEGGRYAVLALGFFLVFHAASFYYIAHGAVFLAGGFGIYAGLHILGLTPPVAIAMGIAVAGVLAWLMDVTVHRRLRRNGASELLELLASFAVLLIVDNLLLMSFGSVPVQVLRPDNLQQPATLAGWLSTPDVLLPAAALVLGALLHYCVRHTAFGRKLRAIGENRVGAEVLGIDTKEVYARVFLLSGVVAGIAAAAVYFETDLVPGTAVEHGVRAIVPVAIAAQGGIPLTLAAAFGLGVLDSTAAYLAGPGWRKLVAYVVLFVVIMVRWRGIEYRGERRQEPF